jgi:hypothetical protein
VQLGADMAIATAWLAVLVHNLILGFRAPGARPLHVRLLGGVVVLALTVVLGVRLERLTGRLVDCDILALVGAALAIAGACLHLLARSVLGPAWSSGVAPRSSGLVADAVRHRAPSAARGHLPADGRDRGRTSVGRDDLRRRRADGRARAQDPP